MWLPPYQIVFLLSVLWKVPQQNYISDYRQLVEKWAEEEHNRVSGHGIGWIDFDAGQKETQEYCESRNVRHRFKECKLGFHQKDFQIDNIIEPKRSEKTLYQISYINNDNKSDKVGFEIKVDYVDQFTVNTEQGLKLFEDQQIKIPVNERISFIDWGIDANLRLNFEWDINNSTDERHNERKIVDVKEKFTLPPFSKAEVKIVMQEVDYDIDFSTNVIIDGFFVVKCNETGAIYVYEAGRVIHDIKNNPSWYSKYLRQLAEPYFYSNWQEGNFSYQVADYRNLGRVKGIFGYNINSEKKTIPLNYTIPTVTKTVTETSSVTKPSTTTKILKTTETERTTLPATTTITETSTKHSNQTLTETLSTATTVTTTSPTTVTTTSPTTVTTTPTKVPDSGNYLKINIYYPIGVGGFSLLTVIGYLGLKFF